MRNATPNEPAPCPYCGKPTEGVSDSCASCGGVSPSALPLPMRRETVSGLLLATLTVLFLALLRADHAKLFVAFLLVFIAAIYVGFALCDGRQQILLTEAIVAILFVSVATTGYLVFPYLLCIGYIAHGFWDLVHSPRRITTTLPDWYPLFCAVYDWGIALYILFRFCLL